MLRCASPAQAWEFVFFVFFDTDFQGLFFVLLEAAQLCDILVTITPYVSPHSDENTKEISTHAVAFMQQFSQGILICSHRQRCNQDFLLPLQTALLSHKQLFKVAHSPARAS